MRPLARPYLQHGSRHAKTGSDPTPGSGIDNDWVFAQVPLGMVAANSEVQLDMGSSIGHQTDDGSVYGEVPGVVTAIGMFAVGTYLIRVQFDFAEGLTGWAMGDAVIGGPVTTYDYNTPHFLPMSFPDDDAGTDFGKYGGLTIWEQLCVVHDLSTTAGAFIKFTNNSANTLIAGSGTLQIFRLT